jgi:hypothetical protein
MDFEVARMKRKMQLSELEEWREKTSSHKTLQREDKEVA